MSKVIGVQTVGTSVLIVMDAVKIYGGLHVRIVVVVVSSKSSLMFGTLGKAQVLPFFCFCGKMIGIMAKKNNTKRKLVGLVSEESGVRAYYTKKNTMNTPDKLSLRKYDPVLRKHVVFTETKKNLGRNEVKEKKR